MFFVGGDEEKYFPVFQWDHWREFQGSYLQKSSLKKWHTTLGAFLFLFDLVCAENEDYPLFH